MSDIPKESAEQKAVIRWWSVACHDFNLPECILMGCPAQAARSPAGWGRIKAEGYRTGTPDLFLAVPRVAASGLFIEMKRSKGGTLSEDQKEMIFRLGERGYSCAVAHGAAEARKVITEYLA